MNHHEKLLVKCEEEPGTHPHCPHGPMLYFYKTSSLKEGFFACSAFRDKNSCGYHTNLKELTDSHKKRRYPMETYDYKKLRRKLKSVPVENRNYCHTCNLPYVHLENHLHSDHNTLQGITNDKFLNPTSFLKPIDNDKVEAQYFFDEKSLKVFESCLNKCNIKKVICIGTPRLHAHIQTQMTQTDSFLLDFDHRYFYFYDDDQFAWYNMCNNHFFDEKQRSAFEKFITLSDGEENLAFFIDPPFGCRTEVVANSIKQLTSLYRTINKVHKMPSVFWVYPYFGETYIRQVMPEMEMSDYKINYTNHESYSDGSKGRKLGSPVRLFSNVPQNLVVLPSAEGYKFCKPCNRWTSKENTHCDICRVCPSKNGDGYRHCVECKTCVKPNYVHCKDCRRCTQKGDHKCAEYQARIRCWICREVGHNEYNCRALQLYKSKKKHPSVCLICRQPKEHNEKSCPKRTHFIQEKSFMGQFTLKFKRRNKK
ncbi:rRNA N6-adenosine-methyltransferase ZCCHC4 [Episyrphus balteatus]|uniref:rRNA N6-adenosine-methyltransferase ZCCHC4 n=1 Tax=Episyrphus balteatus TaxID=286459 RepID=UPI0024868EAC|nr:rRNA N6-adenosine-methyltransferase ZCCHC4 [Episyrphus balteatus]